LMILNLLGLKLKNWREPFSNQATCLLSKATEVQTKSEESRYGMVA